MLTKPFAGWTNVEIGDFSAPASYLTEVPIECLDIMINSLRKRIDFCASFDAEGWTYKVISDYYRTYIIIEDDSLELKIIDKDMFSLANELITDIENNIDSWSHWSLSEEYDGKEAIEKYKQDLLEKIQELKEQINEVQSLQNVIKQNFQNLL